MFKVRTTKTGSGKTAVQVVTRSHQKTKVIKHIGSANNQAELESLLNLANHYIHTSTLQQALLPEVFGLDIKGRHLVAVENLHFTNTYHSYAYEFLSHFYEVNGFGAAGNNLLKNLALVRIIEPCSKLQSLALLKTYFKIQIGRDTMYKSLLTIKKCKGDVEKAAVAYAKAHLAFDFSLVFYDVTTLYFETFKDDKLRKPGFSKDNKPLQPQIVIGLVVNSDGYPIAIDIFKGNTFEGKTIIPVIRRLKKKYNIKTLTVVADAGMLSLDNIKELERQKLSYIVGARIKSLPADLIGQISETLNRKDGAYLRTLDTNYGTLISNYSHKRAIKDKSDRKKQILRALRVVNNPSAASRRSRFVKETTKSHYELNQELISQDELTNGIKGYYTNLTNITNELVVDRYTDLWHVEKSFRIAKSDLLARPIFHHKQESIEAHILIVFVSLCISKSLELLTGISIKKIRDMIFAIQDIEFVDSITNKKFLKRMDMPENAITALWQGF